mmetsp:Transcript_91223/g.294873  ORF Transcript_91223/g.294873 Transcript_91223/m.294873 type:complete len:465 (+) Transcript_91223:401-1795(+)
MPCPYFLDELGDRAPWLAHRQLHILVSICRRMRPHAAHGEQRCNWVARGVVDDVGIGEHLCPIMPVDADALPMAHSDRLEAGAHHVLAVAVGVLPLLQHPLRRAVPGGDFLTVGRGALCRGTIPRRPAVLGGMRKVLVVGHVLRMQLSSTPQLAIELQCDKVRSILAACWAREARSPQLIEQLEVLPLFIRHLRRKRLLDSFRRRRRKSRGRLRAAAAAVAAAAAAAGAAASAAAGGGESWCRSWCRSRRRRGANRELPIVREVRVAALALLVVLAVVAHWPTSGDGCIATLGAARHTLLHEGAAIAAVLALLGLQAWLALSQALLLHASSSYCYCCGRRCYRRRGRILGCGRRCCRRLGRIRGRICELHDQCLPIALMIPPGLHHARRVWSIRIDHSTSPSLQEDDVPIHDIRADSLKLLNGQLLPLSLMIPMRMHRSLLHGDAVASPSSQEDDVAREDVPAF